MVEQGLVQYIQNGLGTPPLAPGGWATELPKDTIGTNPGQFLMAWRYYSLVNDPTYVLASQDSACDWFLRIDCHGTDQVHANQLARAIDGVLRGLPSGITLPDPDNTFVQGIFRESPAIDGYSDLNRSFVRTLEYRVIYNQI